MKWSEFFCVGHVLVKLPLPDGGGAEHRESGLPIRGFGKTRQSDFVRDLDFVHSSDVVVAASCHHRGLGVLVLGARCQHFNQPNINPDRFPPVRCTPPSRS